MKSNKTENYLKFVLATVLLIVFGFFILPGLTRMPFLEVVQHNLKCDYDATAYFYSEIEGYEKFENAVKNYLKNDDSD